MALEDFEKKFFEHLKAEFETSFPDLDTPQAELARDTIKRYKDAPDSITVSDVYALEVLILGMQPSETLIQRAPALREKYHELVGDRVFAAYRPAPFPDKLDDVQERRPLLADLHQILHFLHWNYLFSPIVETLRKGVIKEAIRYIIGYSVLWVIFVALFYNIGQPFLAVLATVMYAGLIGGFVSSQRRMQMIPTGGDPLSSVYEIFQGEYFLWFAPLTGAIFAVILMLFFISGILQGIIFPAFFPLGSAKAAGQTIVGGFWQFTSQLLPKTSADYALLFLWSFIAGFAERFVPDAIDRLTSRAQQAQGQVAQSPTGKTPGTGAPSPTPPPTPTPTPVPTPTPLPKPVAVKATPTPAPQRAPDLSSEAFLAKAGETVLVFQYGSNCSKDRINGPDRLNQHAHSVAKAQTVDDFELAFDVKSEDGSAVSDLVSKPGSKAWGALYSVPTYLIQRNTAAAKSAKSLDAIEAEGTNYRRETIAVRRADTQEVVPALTYRAKDPQSGLKTTLEYVGFIVKGLRDDWGVDPAYVQKVKDIAAANNPDIASEVGKL